MNKVAAIAGFLCAGLALGQSTTQIVNIPVPASTAPGSSVPVSVTVTPTEVTVGGTVISIPQATTATTPVPAAAGGTSTAPGGCTRPSGNTGTGLYVACARVNNPDGTEFRLRGVNRAHFDQPAATGMALAGANVNRVFYAYDALAALGWTASTFQTDFLANADQKIVTVATMASNGANAATSCSSDATVLTSTVNKLVADKALWTLLNKTGIVNIANEWGPANSATWQSAYKIAINTLRSAGFTMPLMIDSGGCGQDAPDILTYGAALAAADPQHNVLLSFHLYGNTSALDMPTYFSQFAALARKNSGLAIVIGEFGPGRNIGASPTMITPDAVIAAAEANKLGWIAWAWDDNDSPGCRASDHSFSLINDCANYTGLASQLTTPYGVDVLRQLKALAPAKATVF